MTLPKWPGFVVMEGAQALSAISALDWPGKISRSLGVLLGAGPEISIAADDARRLAERGGIGIQ